MTKCKGCKGFGYYIIPTDVSGAKHDKKKTCGDCGGTGKCLEGLPQ